MSTTNVKNEGVSLAAIRQISSPEITAIYGGTVTIPDGWELVASEPRVVKNGEWWLSLTTGKPEYCSWQYSSPHPPYKRLIVRPASGEQKAKVVEAAKPKVKVPFSTVSGGMAWTATTTVKDIYGVDEVEIPEGYRYVAFRVPEGGEQGLNQLNPSRVVTYTPPNGINDKPRIIVEKVEPPKVFLIHSMDLPSIRLFFATTDQSGPEYFCQKGISTTELPYLSLSAGSLEKTIHTEFPAATVRRAKGVQQ